MRKFAGISIFMVMPVVVAAQPAPATEALVAETQAALNSGDAQHAAALAEAGLKDAGVSASERGSLLLYRGLAEELSGSRDEAMRDFTAALEIRALPGEDRAQALLQRGFLRDGLGRLDEAAADYTAVIALKGNSLATALNNRANIYRRQNRFALARRDYLAALSANGGKPQYCWYGLGQIAEAQGDTMAARGLYAKAVAADSGYVLATERLEALGGPPEELIASSHDQIVLHPPGSVPPAAKEAKAARKAIVVARPQTAPAVKAGGIPVVLRPALDQARAALHAGGPAPGEFEVQLGAWRSEGEANAGWDQARLRAGGTLDGLNPRIVAADLPGKGRYYRLRVKITGGQNQSAFCADLSLKGVACLPARD